MEVEMKAILKEKKQFGSRDVLYVFDCPELASKAKPGQFVEVKVSDGMEPFLRRPISIFDATENELKLLVRTVGTGTKLMTAWEAGKEVDILGPLGNGFDLEQVDQKALLIGGGIGAAPLYFLARELQAKGKDVKLLFLPKRDAVVLESFGDLIDAANIVFAENRHAFPDVLKEVIKTGDEKPQIFTCGPTAMMKTATQVALEEGAAIQVSLEERMGCGIGICAGCAVAIKIDDGDFTYKKVCKDGPVFNGEEVLFS